MPHIETAMRWSRRKAVGDLVFGNLLRKKDIITEASSVKSTFSSWDNCMQASYCKYPVIAIIVIGGLILLGILWCIVRCCCCGYSCCCSCFRFLSCCDCCGDSCAGKKDKPMKHLDDPYPPQQGYQAPAPMMGGGLGVRPEPPQYAQFEVGRNGLFVEPKAAVSEDALPPMPSWDSAAKKHVMTEEEKNAVELGELDPATGQKMPLMTSAAAAGQSMPSTPGHELPGHELGHSPYGSRVGQGVGDNGYMGVPGDQYGQSPNFNSPVGYPGQGIGGQGRFASPGPQGMNGESARFGSPGPQNINAGPGRYGSPGPKARGYGSPGPQNMNGSGRGGYSQTSPQDGSRGGPGRGFGPPSPQDPYAQDNGFTGAAMPNDGYGRGDGYSRGNGRGDFSGRGQPQRQFSNDDRPFPPQPVRQYSNDSSRPMNSSRGYSDRPNNLPPQQGSRGPSRGPGGPNRMASPPLNNNSGFDFGMGDQQVYSSRPTPPPQQSSYGSSNNGRRPGPPRQNNDSDSYYEGGSTAPQGYPSRSPPPQEASYPGYKPYQPPASSQNGRGPPAGRPREPQGWDPVRQ